MSDASACWMRNSQSGVTGSNRSTVMWSPRSGTSAPSNQSSGWLDFTRARGAAIARRLFLLQLCDLGAQGLQHRLPVDALGFRLLLDPFALERRGLRLDLGDQLRVRDDDRDLGLAHRRFAFRVGRIPGLARTARESLAQERLDRLAIGFRDLIPLRLIGDPREAHVVEAARNVGDVLDERHELERERR